MPVVGAGRDGDAVAAPSDQREGHRRVRHGRVAARRGERGHRRAAAVRRAACRHAPDAGSGMACHARPPVPHRPGDHMIDGGLLSRAASLRTDRVPFVVATVVRVERPASAKPGDCALVLADGTLYGFAGGECAEATVRSEAASRLTTGESVLLRITPGAGAPVLGDGLVVVPNHCLSGGTIDVFLEVVRPPMLILIYGETPI